MAETAEQKLVRYEYVLDAQMVEIDKLRAEVKRLLDWIMGDADAHTCLQAVYNDPAASQTNRVKAASAAIGYELRKPAEPPVLRIADLMPLQDLLEARRARQDRLQAAAELEQPPFKVLNFLPLSNGKRGDDS